MQRQNQRVLPHPQADVDRRVLWRTVMALATTPAERVVLVESFVHDRPPRTIQARHSQLFPDVAAVYKTKRKLFERLQRSPNLQRLREGGG